MRSRLLLLSLTCISIQFSVVAQQTDTAAFRLKFDKYLQNDFQEKIYIHSDKDVYLAGEILWMKIYCVEAYTTLPSDASKLAYVELLDAQNKPVAQAKVKLEKGRGSGSFYLPVTLASGNYRLRSYTNFMKNFGPESFFQRSLLVYNTVKEEEVPASLKEERKIAVQFFPESGNLVSGLTSKVAFKIVDSEGNAVNSRGAILDGNDTIARFRPSKFGLGSFYFKPEKLRSYRAVIIPVNGKPFSASLPRIYESGVVMTVKRDSSLLRVVVQSNVPANEKFTLFVHSGYRSTFVRTLEASQISEGFIIPIQELGDGISHLTLFDAAHRPVCERLFFKKPEKLLHVDLSSDKSQYSAREKVTLTVGQTDNHNKPTRGDFSIAVYKVDALAHDTQDIASHLWLTSELRGNVENASWYFNNPYDDSTDDLMLTHGWRRFNWNAVFNEEKPVVNHLPEIQGHIVSGRVLNANNEAVSKKMAFLSVPGSRIQLYTSSADINGTVNFYTRDFQGPAEIIVQADLRTDSLLKVEINSPFSTDFSDSLKRRFDAYPDKGELLRKSVAMQVNNIYHFESLNKQRLSDIDSTAFYRKPDKVYKLDEYVRFTTMEEVLREYVPDVTVVLKNKSYQLKMFSPALGTYLNTTPFILIDGVPVFDEGQTILKTDPREIQRFEIVSEPYVYGQNVFSGILSFHTYKGDLAGFKLPQQAQVLDYEGLQNIREFYSPMYSEDKAKYSRLPDYRTTLFWSSTNDTDKDGKAMLELYTSDVAGKYQVVVQSLSSRGEAGSAIAQFEVIPQLISKEGR